MLCEIKTQAIADTVMRNLDGCTVSLDGTIPSLRGFMVAVTDIALDEKYQERKRLRRFLDGVMRKAAILNIDVFYIGAWKNPEDRKLYLDVSLNVPTVGEAKVLGTIFKQHSIYDLEHNNSIRIEEVSA